MIRGERYTADMYVKYFTEHRGITLSDIGVREIVLLSWGQSIVTSLARDLNATRCHNWFYDEGHIVYPLFSAQIGDREVSLVQCPEGAPSTVMMMEELIACGATTFLGIGWAGSLYPSARIGSLLLPVDCVSSEGTSAHYLSGPGAYTASIPLSDTLRAAASANGILLHEGLLWTTDAPYRELVDDIRAFQSRGVIGVDMESSAMYSLAHFRNVSACNVLVVSDELWDTWKPAFREQIVASGGELAQRLLVKCVEMLQPNPR